MKTPILALGAIMAAMMSGLIPAIAQQGVVATACEREIATYCATQTHGQGAVRKCLEGNLDKLSNDCKAALDNTGPGKGMGQRRLNPN